MKDELQNVKVGEELINVSSMYESLRYNDYSIENGIGEIVDNSVEAGAGLINVFFEKKEQIYGKRKIETIDEIVIVDNGCGMDDSILGKCLVLGVSIREKRNGKAGIGRFGVGMTLGGISLARKIEVYSRKNENDKFKYTFIDLDMISANELKKIPDPEELIPPEKYESILDDATGTIVILSKCDRLDGTGRRVDANDVIAKVTNYLARTYRKFIAGGTQIYLNGKKIYLHDPLYMMGPTQFDTKDSQDPKAILYSKEEFTWEIPDSDDKATVTITLSLLPKEWRLNIGDGGNTEAKKRKIDQNEGISILRADREVLYDKIPYLIGAKGQASYEDNDRWWGCEISFPPELDECFQVRYIKRGAEPIGALKDKIKEVMTGAISSLRKEIKADRAQRIAEDNKLSGEYERAEKTMADIAPILPNNLRGKGISKEEEETQLHDIVEDLLLTSNDGENLEIAKAKKKEALKTKPYSIEMVKYPQTILFEPVFLMEKVILKINVNHPFYKKVIQPLCGNIAEETDQSNNVRAQVKDAIMLLLLSYTKAEAMFKDDNDMFEALRTQWGATLSMAVNQIGMEL